MIAIAGTLMLAPAPPIQVLALCITAIAGVALFAKKIIDSKYKIAHQTDVALADNEKPEVDKAANEKNHWQFFKPQTINDLEFSEAASAVAMPPLLPV